MSSKSWEVVVSVDGDDVISIGSNGYLAGVSSPDQFREQIIAAAEHLIAFIGREDGPYFDFPPSIPSQITKETKNGPD